MDKKFIYLDGAANAPLDPRVLKAMLPYMQDKYCGNSHGIHAAGVTSMLAIENARDIMSKCFSVSPKEIYFTSGATESNNWVFNSMIKYMIQSKPGRNEIIVSAIEHSSVLAACKQAEIFGIKIKYVQPDIHGRIPVKNVGELLSEKTLLVCVMLINNETGVGNNIESIGQLAHKKGAFMMSDCTQAFTYGDGSLNLSVYPHVDYFTFSGHKLYGPTGVGCLIARECKPLYPFVAGGAQELGLRGGTHNTAAIVGLGKAVDLLRHRSDMNHYKKLYHILTDGIKQINAKYGVYIHINTVPTHKNIVSLNCSDVGDFTDFASTLSLMRVGCSAGAACEAVVDENSEPTPSHVLLAMGLSEAEARKSVRISFTKYTTITEIKTFVKRLEHIVKISSQVNKLK